MKMLISRPEPDTRPRPVLNRRGFIKLVASLTPVLLIAAPRRCSPGPATPTARAAGYGAGKYGAGKFG
jgi:hypothetical protein